MPCTIQYYVDTLCSIPVCGGKSSGSDSNVLYDLKFIQTTNGEHLLVVSGDPGILIYKWSYFEGAIAAAIDVGGDEQPKPKKPKCQDPQPPRLSTDEITPITTFKPHTSPTTSFGGSVEFNSTSYSKTDDILYGAAGDVFGCYQWDLATETFLGTFGGGGSSRYNGSGHRDYLHVVKTIPDAEGMGSRYVMTGGEDGNIGIWDAKSRQLIEMMNIQSTMDKNKDLVSSNTTTSSSRGFLSTSSTSWSNSGPNSWVSSMDTNGDWLAVCGGTENTIGLTSRSGPSTSGFMTLWHLPTRTFTSGCVTRESINTVVHNHPLGCFVSGGNEGRISFWESSSLVRSGRSWCTTPAYTISVDPDSSGMVVGGAGGTLDRFVDRVKVSQLQISS